MNNIMNNSSNIELVVMRRIRLIRILTLIISTVTLAVLAGVAALWGIGREVWVAHVFQNMPRVTDVNQFITFWLAAFTNTSFLVQMLVVFTALSFLFLIRELVRFIASFFSPAAL